MRVCMRYGKEEREGEEQITASGREVKTYESDERGSASLVLIQICNFNYNFIFLINKQLITLIFNLNKYSTAIYFSL